MVIGARAANIYEFKARKFTHASRRLNILANDILRYIELCESLAHIARDAQLTHEHMNSIGKQIHIKKGQEQVILGGQFSKLQVRLYHLHKSFKSKLKLLLETHRTYKKNLDRLSRAIKI